MIDQDALKKILGPDRVVSDPAEVERRARCLIPEVQPPEVFVYPGSIEDIRAVLRLANEKGFSVPAAKENWGYGSPGHAPGPGAR
ncbi:MAG: FAD-binding oxidoreductase [Elusimicrobia bacterium]|nr:FAD-binding oxidoreductase [Elusimicrobiota bacterium]